MSLTRRVVPAVLAVLALGATPSLAQQVAGDNGLPPSNAKQCQAKVKGVDDALKWENARWSKLSGRKLDLRAKIAGKIKAAKATMAEIKAQMDALEPPMDAAEAAFRADPSLENAFMAVQNEYLGLEQDYAELEQRLPGWAYQIDDIDTEMTKLEKLHRSNVRNTVRYRKQVVDYCNTRF